MSDDLRAKLLNLVRPAVRTAAPYIAAENEEHLAERVGIPLHQLIKLDANENLYGASPRVQATLANYARCHIYPDPDQARARAAVAAYFGVPVETVLLGSGSDELIHLLTLVYLERGDEVIDFTPSFAMYPIYSHLMEARMVEIPRDAAYDLDADAGLRAVTDRTKIIFVANPNNPTGTMTARAEILRLLESERIVVVDEAYAEFASHSMVRDVQTYPNLIVLRSFSKWSGLAGLRAGAIVAQEHILQHFWNIKSPFNLNSAAGLAVRASLEDLPYLQDCIRKITAERAHLAAALGEFDYFKVYPSEGNFIYLEVTRGEARAIKDYLALRGVAVRHFGGPPRITQGLRITVGKPEHTEALIAALLAMPRP